jgi:hypothetical protein
MRQCATLTADYIVGVYAHRAAAAAAAVQALDAALDKLAAHVKATPTPSQVRQQLLTKHVLSQLHCSIPDLAGICIR